MLSASSDTMVDVSIIRVRVWKELSWAANFVDDAIVPDLLLLELITMQVYVQPRVVKPTEYIVDRIQKRLMNVCPLQRIHLSVIETRLGWTTT